MTMKSHILTRKSSRALPCAAFAIGWLLVRLAVAQTNGDPSTATLELKHGVALFSVSASYASRWTTSGTEPGVIVALLADGNVLQSNRFVRSLSKIQVQAFMGRVRNTGLLDPTRLRKWWSVGPDNDLRCIQARWMGATNEMCSWHETFEAAGTAVGDDIGIAPRNGISNDEAIARSSEDYREFRKLWTALRCLGVDLQTGWTRFWNRTFLMILKKHSRTSLV